MTKLLEQAIETVRALSPNEQDAIAREMLALADDENSEDEEDIDPADLKAVLEGIADADAGRIATDEDVEAAFRRFSK